MIGIQNLNKGTPGYGFVFPYLAKIEIAGHKTEFHLDERGNNKNILGAGRIIRSDFNILFLFSPSVTGPESYLDFSFPTRGNVRLREDGNCASSRSPYF
jgi:hypothetical protein